MAGYWRWLTLVVCGRLQLFVDVSNEWVCVGLPVVEHDSQRVNETAYGSRGSQAAIVPYSVFDVCVRDRKSVV